MLPILFMDLIDDPQDQIRYEEIWHAYQKRMHWAAYHILRNYHDAEDAVQDAFLRIAKNMANIHAQMGSRELEVYVLKAARREACAVIRANKRYRGNVSLGFNDDIPDEQFWGRLEEQQEYNRLVKAIRALPPENGDPVFYHYVLELSFRKTAELLGISTSTAKRRVYEGKKMLLIDLDKKAS